MDGQGCVEVLGFCMLECCLVRLQLLANDSYLCGEWIVRYKRRVRVVDVFGSPLTVLHLLPVSRETPHGVVKEEV